MRHWHCLCKIETVIVFNYARHVGILNFTLQHILQCPAHQQEHFDFINGACIHVNKLAIFVRDQTMVINYFEWNNSSWPWVIFRIKKCIATKVYIINNLESFMSFAQKKLHKFDFKNVNIKLVRTHQNCLRLYTCLHLWSQVCAKFLRQTYI